MNIPAELPPNISSKIPTKLEQKSLPFRLTQALNLNPNVEPILESLFDNEGLNPQEYQAIMKLGDFSFICQYPPIHYDIDQEYQFTIITVNLITKQWIPDMIVEIKDRTETVLFSGKTNAIGCVNVHLKLSNQPNPKLMILVREHLYDHAVSLIISPTIDFESIPQNSQMQMSLFPDKRLYKPGEMVHFFGFIWYKKRGTFFPLKIVPPKNI
jgi:hypothetical protein